MQSFFGSWLIISDDRISSYLDLNLVLFRFMSGEDSRVESRCVCQRHTRVQEPCQHHDVAREDGTPAQDARVVSCSHPGYWWRCQHYSWVPVLTETSWRLWWMMCCMRMRCLNMPALCEYLDLFPFCWILIMLNIYFSVDLICIFVIVNVWNLIVLCILLSKFK